MSNIFGFSSSLTYPHIKKHRTIHQISTVDDIGEESFQLYSQTNSQMRNAAMAARMRSATRTPIKMPTFRFDETFSLLVRKSICSWWPLRPWCRKGAKHSQRTYSKYAMFRMQITFTLITLNKWEKGSHYSNTNLCFNPNLKKDTQLILQGFQLLIEQITCSPHR